MPEELKHEPEHLFCERGQILWGHNVLYIALLSGGRWNVSVVTPDHAKQLLRRLQQRIDEYEKEHGILEGKLPDEPQKSPIQFNQPQ